MRRSDFVIELDKRVPLDGKTVLELGCGDGVFTRELALFAKSVHAVDGRVEQIKATQDRCKKRPNVSCLVSDVEREFFDLPLRPFDVVFHVGLLYHLNDPITNLTKSCRMAKEALFLDTHYTTSEHFNSGYVIDGHSYMCQIKDENTNQLREGLRVKSRLITQGAIATILRDNFYNVAFLWERAERNGRRATILATSRRSCNARLRT